jgi:hypothetical protein
VRSVGDCRDLGARKDFAEVLFEVEATELGRKGRHVLDDVHLIALDSLQTT